MAVHGPTVEGTIHLGNQGRHPGAPKCSRPVKGFSVNPVVKREKSVLFCGSSEEKIKMPTEKPIEITIGFV